MKYAAIPVALLCASTVYAQDTSAVAPVPAVATVEASSAAAVTATPAPVVATARSVTPGSATLLPPNTEILVSMNAELNSKKAREGTTFMLSVSQDVMLGNYIIIPRGTPAHGEVTWRTGKGAFGKSAKMEFEIRYLDLNGRRVPLVGHFRQEGKGNTGATIGTAIAAGVFSAFVTGKSAIVEQGREFRVFTREALDVVIPVASSN